MANINRVNPLYLQRDTLTNFDHFRSVVTAHEGWTTLVADTTPTVTCPDAVNGLARLFTDTTDNNEVALRTTAELFKFGTNRSLVGACKMQYAENDTNKANVFFGFCSALAANTITDNGAAFRTSGDAFGIFKTDGITVWRVITMTNGTQVITTSTTTAGGSAAQEVEMQAVDFDGVTMTCTVKVDGVYLKDSNGNVIRHSAVIASATEMNFGWYVKSGGGAGGETLDVDWGYYSQRVV
jgi:hypothetical protein